MRAEARVGTGGREGRRRGGWCSTSRPLLAPQRIIVALATQARVIMGHTVTPLPPLFP